MNNKCKLQQWLFDRWILVNAGNEDLAWSGSRWVEIGGSVQVCNFDTQTEAREYANEFGLEIISPA